MAGLQGRVFGGFQLTEQLNGGGIADVYRGRPSKPGGRDVVVKIIYPEFARQPGFIPHFRQIVQSASRLASHPHILPLIAHGEEGGYLFLVTPYVAAGTLKDSLGGGGRLGAADVAPFFRQLCDAVAYAHSLGVVHGNLKPSNVFLFEGRHVLVGDFGMLWDITQMDMDHAGSGSEAVNFLAPEVAAGQSTQLSDIYSLGALLFASLTGYAPFRGSTPSEVLAAHQRQPVPQLAQANPTLPPPVLALDAVIQRAMAKRPEERYPSSAAVAQAIEQIVRQQPAAAQQPAMPSYGMASPSMMPMAPSPLGGQGGPLPAQGYPPSQLGEQYAAPVGVTGGFGVGQAPGGSLAPAVPLSSTLGQFNPPFPPLPSSASIDEQMEFGRSGTLEHDVGQQSTLYVPAPAGGDVPLQPTMRVPAPAQRDGSAPAEASFHSEQIDWNGFGDGEDFAPQVMPAIRGMGGAASAARPVSHPGMSNPGFMVAGGSGNLSDELYGSGEGSAFGAREGGNDYHDGNGSSQHAAWSGNGQRDDMDAYSPAHTDEQGWNGTYTGEQDIQSAEPVIGTVLEDGRTFSPTQLGLPRLTSPNLEDVPPSWQDLVSGPVAAAGQHNGSAHGGKRAWSSAPTGEEPWQAESGAWSASGGWEQSSVGASVQTLDDPWSASASSAQVPSFLEQPRDRNDKRKVTRKDKRKAAQDEEDYDAFDDDRVWTVGTTAVRRKNRRWVRRLTFVLALVLLADMLGLVVVRPDLCPTSGCRDWSVALHHRFPILNSLTVPVTAPVTATPNALSLTVAQEKSTSATVTITNSGSLDVTWKAVSSLAWLTVDPASGSLPTTQGIPMTVTAKPTGVPAGTYTGSITVTAESTTITVPVTVTVTSGS